MKKQQHGKDAPASAEQEPKSEVSLDVPERTERSWGRGAATALERLRRNDYRAHPGKPDHDRPDSD